MMLTERGPFLKMVKIVIAFYQFIHKQKYIKYMYSSPRPLLVIPKPFDTLE